MDAELEIIIPARNPSDALIRTVASLIAQTDRKFSVMLSDDCSVTGAEHWTAAQNQFATAGIAVRRVSPAMTLKQVEHWNWSHNQSQARWLKVLMPGEQLKPHYVARLRERIATTPAAQFIRCDAELETDWGIKVLKAPFSKPAVAAGEAINYFPAEFHWLSRSVHFAYSRTAWLALGGFLPQLPTYAVLNLNVLMALHFGIENIPESLATTTLDLNENPAARVNHWLELWLVLRQAKNYCLAAKLPWPEQCLFWRSFTLALKRQ